jgi:sec-independent protein translocase protein TatB
MFDISFTELLIIGIIALVVIGPERLPKVARTLGHLIGRAQRYVHDVKSDIQREVELDELRKLKDQMQDAAQSVQSGLQNTEAALRQPLEAFEQSTMSTLNELKAPLASTDAAASSAEPAVVASAPAQLELDSLDTSTPHTDVPATGATAPKNSPGSKPS